MLPAYGNFCRLRLVLNSNKSMLDAIEVLIYVKVLRQNYSFINGG